MDLPDTLQQAIDEARSGNRMGASRLLAQYVTQNPQNDVAWLWLAACLEEPEQQLYCLKKASSINPNNPDTISSLNELINPPWAWNDTAEAIELPAGNGEVAEGEMEAAPAESGESVFVFPEPESFSFEPAVEEPIKEQLEPVADEAEPQPKKTGMSGSQVTILVVLVIAIIVVLAVLGYMVITASPDSLPPFLRNLLYGGGLILGPGF